MRALFNRFDVRISLVYFIVALVTIIISEFIVGSLFTNSPSTQLGIDIAVGMIFVLVTTLIIFVIATREADKRSQIENTLRRQTEERQQLLEALQKQSRIRRILSESDQTLVRATDEHTFLQSICDLLIRDGGYRMAWIGYAQQDEPKSIQAVAFSGDDTGYLDQIHLTWDSTPTEQGMTGAAIHNGEPIVCRFILTDPRCEPTRKQAVERGYASSASLPVHVNDQIIGALSIYATQADAFDPAELELLAELADDIGFGIQSLRTAAENKRNQEEIAHSHARLQQILENLPVGATLFNSKGTITYANSQAETILGFAHGDLEHRSHVSPNWNTTDLDGNPIPVQDLPFAHAMRTGQPVLDYELAIQKQGSERILLSVNCSPVLKPDGTVSEVIATLNDISEIHQQTLLLRESEQRFRLVVENAPEAIFVQIDRKFAYVNPAGLKMFGATSSDQLIGRPILERFHPDYHDFVTDRMNTLNHDQKTVEPSEDGCLRMDGSLFYVEVYATPLTYQGRQGSLVFARDISLRKAAEESLRIKDNALASSFTPFALADLEGKITYVNPAFLKLWKYNSEQDILGKSVINFWHQPGVAAEIIRTLENSGHYVGNLVARLNDGSTANVELVANLVTGSTDQPICMMASFMDVSEHERMNQALFKSTQQQQAILRAIPDLMFRTSADGIILDYHAPSEDLLAAPPEIFLGKNLKEVLPPDIGQTSLEAIQRVIATQQEVRYEYALVLDGIEHEYESRLVPVGENEVLAIVRDVTDRKQAEAARRSSEEKFTRVFAASPDAIIITSLKDGRYLEVNDSYITDMGYSREELIGHTSLELGIWANPEQRDQLVQLLENHGSVRNMEAHFRRKSGEIIFALVSSEIIELDGEICLLSIVKDFTERSVMEEKLRASEARQKALLTAIPDLIFRLTLDGIFLDFQGPQSNLLAPAEFFIGKKIADVLPPDVAAVSIEAIDRLRQTGQSVIYEYNMDVDGETHAYEARLVPLEGAQEVLSIVREVTERKRAEETIRSSEEKFSKAFAASPDSYIISSLESGRYLEVNESFLRSTGYSREEIIGRTSVELNIWANLEQRKQMAQMLRSQGSIRNFEAQFFRKNGDLRIAQISAETIELHGERCLVSIVRDITDLKATEYKLRESEARQKALLVAMPDPLFIMSEDGTFIDFHGNAPDLRIPLDKLIGHKIQSLLSPGDSQHLIDALHETRTNRNRTVSEFNLRIGDQTFSYEARLVPLEGSDNLMAIIRNITDRKHAEEALRASEERYRIISGMISDYAYSYRVLPDNTMKREWITDSSYKRITGYEVGEIDSRGTFTLYAPEEQQRVEADVKATLRGEITQNDYRFFTKQGEERWLHIARYPVWDDNEKRVIRFYGVAQDVTEQKQAEAVLRASEEKYRSLIESSDASILMIDQQGSILFLNEIAAQSISSTASEIQGKNIQDVFTEEQAAQMISIAREVIRSSSGLITEAEAALSGESRWYRISIQPVRDASGKPYAAMIFSTDITARKRSEVELYYQNQILQQSRDMIALSDTSGRCTFINKGGAALMGVDDPLSLVGKMIGEFHIPEDAQHVLETHLPAAIQTGQWRGRNRLRNVDGHLIDVEQSIFPIRDSDGTIAFYATIMTDITERIKAEEAVRTSEEKYRSLIESSDAMIAMYTEEGNLLYANMPAAMSLGKDPSTIIGMNMHELFPPAVAERQLGTIQKVIRQGVGQVNEAPSIVQGKERWYRTSVQPVRDAFGHITAALIHATDITRFKAAEVALRQSEEQFRQFMRYVPGSVFIEDQAGVTLYCNDLYAQTNERQSPADLIGLNIRDYMEEAYTARYLEENQKILKQGNAQEFNHVITHPKNGNSYWLTIKFPIPRENDSAVIGGISLDVTKERLAEEELRQSEARYRQMFEVHGVPKLIIDPNDGKIVDANSAAARFYGYDQAMLRTMNIFDVNLSPIEEVQSSMAKARKEEVLSCIYQHRGASGNPRSVEVFTGSVDQGGKQLLYSIITDITEKVHAEAALQDTLDSLEQRVTERTTELQKIKDRLEAIFNHSADGILLLDLQKGIQQANYAFEKLFDLPEGSYTGVQLETFVSPEHAGKLAAIMEAVAAEHQTQHIEAQAKRADGSSFDIELSLAPVNRSEKAVTSLVCIIRDISERKQAEHTLAEERNLLRTVIDAVPDFIYVKDTQHRMLLNNLAHTRSLGANHPSEVLGKTDFDLFAPELAMKFHIDEVRILNNGEAIHNTDERTIAQDGSEIWALTTKVPLRNLMGEIIGLVGITHDISKIKKSEEALRESEELYRTTITAMSEGIILRGQDGTIKFCNASAESILGMTADQLMGRTPSDPALQYIREDGSPMPFDEHPAMVALHTGLPQSNVVMGVQKAEDKITWVLSNSQPLFDPTLEQADGVVTTFADITDRKAAEAELERRHQQELEMQRYLTMLHEITIRLTRAETLEDFYRSTIEEGMRAFGFERMGLLLYDAEADMAIGTYGTDAEGNITDEHQIRLSPDKLTGILRTTLDRSHRFAYDEDVSLFSNMKPIGRGSNAVAALWNGSALGWVAVDNAIHHKPITPTQLEVLSLYALTVGSLLSRKRAEFALRESESRYQSVVQTQTELICRYQPDLTLTFVNNAYCRYFNRTPEQIIGKSFLEFVPESEREDIKAFYANLIATRGTVTYEHRATLGDGTERWQLWTDTAITDESGEVTAIQAVGVDITDRKIAENALRESEERFRAFIESAPISTLVTDPNGIIVVANRESEKVFGYTQEELIGQSINVLVPDNTQRIYPDNGAEYLNLSQSRRLSGLEMVGRRKDNTHFPCEIQLSYVDMHPTPLVMSFVLDITQRKEAEQALKQALEQEKELGELKSRFVSMASHEFRTPLAAILATTETLTIYRDKMNSTQIDIRLDKIRQQVMHMKDIMEDVLQLARIQAGRVKYEPSMENIDSLCHDVIEEFNIQEQHRGRIQYHSDESVETLYYDPRLMRQVITNLISNALKYSSSDKPVYLNLMQNETEVTLTIRDEGIGIPAEDLKHLFEPFHRATNVGTISGTGLGLSITKQAVELHSGTIVAESEEGVGTTITVVIPRRDEISNPTL